MWILYCIRVKNDWVELAINSLVSLIAKGLMKVYISLTQFAVHTGLEPAVFAVTVRRDYHYSNEPIAPSVGLEPTSPFLLRKGMLLATGGVK